MRHLVAAAACAALLAACTGGDDHGQSEPDATGTSVGVQPSPPRFQGRTEVTLQPALAYVGKQDVCPPDPGPPERLCDPQGQAYRPLGSAREATVRQVETELNSGHTAWTVTVLFARQSRPDVEGATTEAREMGGVVLVVDPKDGVLVAAGPADIEADRIVLDALDKPTAWALVTAFADA